MKRLVLILIMSFFICGSIPAAQLYTFKTQSMVLYNEVFPAVEKYISSFKLLPYTQAKGQFLANKVGEIINRFSEQGSIKLQIYPDVSLFKFDNDIMVAYHIKVLLVLVDSDSDSDFPVMILIGKHFIILKHSKRENA